MTDKSASELEREAETVRAKVADTAESIRSKMSPGQLMDEFTNYVSGGDGSVALRNLGTQVRDNPLPLVLVGAGLAWLMLGPSGQTNGSQGATSLAQPSDGAGTPRGGSFARGRGVADAVTNAGASAGELGRSAAESLSGLANSAVNTVAGLGGKGKGSASALLGQDPLVLAALGMAVGTAIGAILPQTEIENEQLGPYRDRLLDGAEDVLDKGAEAAKDVAGKAYATAKNEADSDRLKGGTMSVAEKVGEVVKAVAEEAEPDIRKRLGGKSVI